MFEFSIAIIISVILLNILIWIFCFCHSFRGYLFKISILYYMHVLHYKYYDMYLPLIWNHLDDKFVWSVSRFDIVDANWFFRARSGYTNRRVRSISINTQMGKLWKSSGNSHNNIMVLCIIYFRYMCIYNMCTYV